MNRTVQVCEKCVYPDPDVDSPIVVAAATETQLLPDHTKSSGEWVTRSIQNVGANPINIGVALKSGDGSKYHFQLLATQQLDCSVYGLGAVFGYSTLGTTMAVIECRRYDNDTHPTFLKLA